MTKEKITGSDCEEKEVRTAYLLNGYIRNHLTRTEHRELDDWVTENMVNQRVFEVMTDGLMFQSSEIRKSSRAISHFIRRVFRNIFKIGRD